MNNVLKRWRLLMAALLMAPVLTACANLHVAQDRWTGQDKAKHFAVSALMSATVAQSMHEQPHSSLQRGAWAIGVSVSIGLGKELADGTGKGSGFSWQDLAYDVGGAFAGYQLYRLVH